MIPCKDCLVLPRCKNKVRIQCSILMKWLYDNESSHYCPRNLLHSSMEIRIEFGKVFGNNKGMYYDSHIIFIYNRSEPEGNALITKYFHEVLERYKK
jgi:hypothetical protein